MKSLKLGSQGIIPCSCLREFLGTLYGDVNQYEGKPTDSQVARADVLGRELEDVIHEFQKLTNTDLPAINKQLAAKKMPAIAVITEADWQKAQDAASGGADPSATQARGVYERD